MLPSTLELTYRKLLDGDNLSSGQVRALGELSKLSELLDEVAKLDRDGLLYERFPDLVRNAPKIIGRAPDSCGCCGRRY